MPPEPEQPPVPKPEFTEADFAKAVLRKTASPQLAEIAAHFVDIAGGTRGFAQKLYRDYSKSKRGTVVRERILATVLQALKFANTREEAQTDLSLLSEEDLLAEARGLFRESIQDLQTQLENAKPSPKTKRCTHCKTEKSISDFHRSTNRPDGYQTWCKVCLLEKMREKSQADRAAREAAKAKEGHGDTEPTS